MNLISDFLTVATVHAQLALPKKVDTLSDSKPIIDFLCNTVLSWIFTAAIIFSILMVLIAAFRYMTSSGDPAKVKLASNTLVFTAIGIAVAILARTLPILVGSIVAGQVTLDPCPAGTTPPTTTFLDARQGGTS